MQLEDRHSIKRRLIKDLAREWGRGDAADIDTAQFDPVVILLLEAFAFWGERISNEISDSRERIFERLLEILTPDALTGAQPAHGILHGVPNEAVDATNVYDLFTLRPDSLNRELFFSAAGIFKLFKCRVAYLASDNKIVSINQQMERNRATDVYGQYLDPATLYIGLNLDDKIDSIEELTFFLNWKNEARLTYFLSLAPLARWSVNGKEIKVNRGLIPPAAPHKKINSETIFTALGERNQIENTICSLYEKHFYKVGKNDIQPQHEKRCYPTDFAHVFGEQELKMFKEELLWIKVRFPEEIEDGLESVQCLTNCFPVLNRRLREKNEQLKGQANILALDLEDEHFFSIESLTDGNNISYKQVPIRSLGKYDCGMYAIRKGGVQRFDKRDAGRMLSYVLDLVKDESAAFNALGYNHLVGDLDELKRVLTRVNKNFDINNKKSASAFVFLEPHEESNKAFTIKYWTTEGALANRIGNISLKPYANCTLKPHSIYLVTTTKGGRGALDASESIHAFKEAVMTRGRIVTAEDIKAFCLNRLGGRFIKNIEVRKGVEKAKDVNNGLIRTIDVRITIKGLSPHNIEEWRARCRDVATLLYQKSSGTHPIKIHINQQKNA